VLRIDPTKYELAVEGQQLLDGQVEVGERPEVAGGGLLCNRWRPLLAAPAVQLFVQRAQALQPEFALIQANAVVAAVYRCRLALARAGELLRQGLALREAFGDQPGGGAGPGQSGVHRHQFAGLGAGETVLRGSRFGRLTHDVAVDGEASPGARAQLVEVHRFDELFGSQIVDLGNIRSSREELSTTMGIVFVRGSALISCSTSLPSTRGSHHQLGTIRFFALPVGARGEQELQCFGAIAHDLNTIVKLVAVQGAQIQLHVRWSWLQPARFDRQVSPSRRLRLQLGLRFDGTHRTLLPPVGTGYLVASQA
jgi:hypothetical protein